MRAKDAVGAYGERVAARHLTELGMVVLDRNWRCDAGEIDLVLRDGSVLVFCEVKTRTGTAYGHPLAAVDAVKTERLVRLGKVAFNRDEVVHLHYAESMALAVFLMQARGGEYREAFLDYVKDAYRGLLKGTTGRQLNLRLGLSYEALDEQFLAFLGRG